MGDAEVVQCKQCFTGIGRLDFKIVQANGGVRDVELQRSGLGIEAVFRAHIQNAVRDGDYLGTLRLAYFTVAVIYNLTEAAFKELNLVWMCFLLAMLTVPAPYVPESSSLAEPDAGQAYEDEWRAAEGVVNV